jgi:hypothetical protein
MVETHIKSAFRPQSIVFEEIGWTVPALGHGRCLSGTMFAPIKTPGGGQEVRRQR